MDSLSKTDGGSAPRNGSVPPLTMISSVNSSSRSSATVTRGQGLRRVRGDIPLRLWIAASISFWEKAAFWGLTAPWQNYMQHPCRLSDEDTPGALGLGQAKATRIYCAFYIGYYIAPMLFAILSDSKLGRYRTLLVCLVLFNIGCAMMTISSLPAGLDKGWGLPGLVVSMICVALGGGGFESVMAVFLADQYTDTESRVKTLDSGEQVITDRALTLEYIYGLNYWLGNVGSLSWFATVALEEHAGFAHAYGLTFGFIFISLLTLLIGRSQFLRVPYETMIFAQATKILLCASRNGFRFARADPKYQLMHRQKVVSWSGQLVHELCRALQGCRVLLAFIVFYICFDQMQNNLISQSAQMETGSTPNDMLPAMNQIGCVLFVPLIHHAIYPLLHRRHIYIKPITRITIGFCFVTLSMAYAAVVQNAIYSTGPCYDHPRACSLVAHFEPNHVNVWLQAPIFFLIAMGEAWSYVTALEIAYSHAPKHMKAIIQAIFPLMAGIGSVVALGLTPFAHDPKLVIFYASLAGAMTATTIIFWLLFRKYDEKRDANEAKGAEEAEPVPLTRERRRSCSREGNAIRLDFLDMESGPISTNQGECRSAETKRPDLTRSTLASLGAEDIERAQGDRPSRNGAPTRLVTTRNETKHRANTPISHSAKCSSSTPFRQKTNTRNYRGQQPTFTRISCKSLPPLSSGGSMANTAKRRSRSFTS